VHISVHQGKNIWKKKPETGSLFVSAELAYKSWLKVPLAGLA